MLLATSAVASAGPTLRLRMEAPLPLPLRCRRIFYPQQD